MYWNADILSKAFAPVHFLRLHLLLLMPFFTMLLSPLLSLVFVANRISLQKDVYRRLKLGNN
jgi:hypothetical protein